MSSFSTNVNGKALEFTDTSLSYDGIIYDYTMINDVKHRGGDSPAFIFDYNGERIEIPYNPDDKMIALSYFKKAANMNPAPPVVEEPLTPIDDIADSDSAEESNVITAEPITVNSEIIEDHTEAGPSGNDFSPSPYRSFDHPGNEYSSYTPTEKKFYQKNWFIILLLILFWPVGLFLMWKYAEWKKPVKIIISCLAAISLIFAFIPTSSDESSDISYDATEETVTETTTEEPTTEPTTTEPTTQAPKEFSESDYESIEYEKLARNPDDHYGEKITGSGEVIQVIEGDDEIQLRVAVNDNYDNVILLGYNPAIMDSRVLENDHITYYGTSLGTITYESTLGGNITIPSCYCDKIKIQ